MNILTDSELEVVLKAPEPAIRYIDFSELTDEVDSAIQPTSVDLQVGEICLPPVKKPGRAFDVSEILKTDKHVLGVGQCVRVFTREHINFVGNHSGITRLPSLPQGFRGVAYSLWI